MSELKPRPGIMDIAAYVGGESSIAGHARVIKLSSNENPLGPSPRAIEAFKALADRLHEYPDGGSTRLREAIAHRYGLDAARIVCGGGSDELLSLLARGYAGPGDEVIYTEHGFLMYPIVTKSVGATPVVVKETNLTADIDAILEAVTPRTRIVFLANPNNPTGTYVPAEEVERLRASLPASVLLVIDAAYAEYVTRNDYEPGVRLVEANDNVVMTRTFSKIYGLAALRLGWAYCPPGVADVLNRIRGPFNVNAAALAAGAAAMADVAHVDAARAHNERWLAWTAAELEALGLKTTPAVGNFVLVRFPSSERAEAALAFLNGRGIIPRRVAGYGLPDSLRITIGSEDDMRAVVAAVADFMR